MAKDYTNQHIVPKRYLDRFGTKDGKRTIIGARIVDKGNVRFFTDSTVNVGYIKNYYDVTDKNDPKYWEHYFAREIDTLCGQDIENIIAKVTLSCPDTIVLSAHDKQVLSKLIIAQLMRIPESIDYVKTVLYPRVSAQVKEDLVSTLPPVFVEKHREQIMNTEFPEQYQKELMLNHSFEPANFDRYCKMLQDGIWVVYVNTRRDTMPFLTSDNPVLVEGIGKTETGLFRNGLANPATCIFYPLSPGIAVAIYSRQGILGAVADEYDGRKVLLDELKYIMSRNVNIMAQAHRHSFIPQPLYDAVKNGSIYESQIGDTPMADLKKQLKAIKKLLGDGRDLQLSDADALQYQDILCLLEERGYLHDFQADGANLYRKMEDFDGFEDWLNEEIKVAKRVTRREWAIGIVCAIIGAAIGLIPYIVSLL